MGLIVFSSLAKITKVIMESENHNVCNHGEQHTMVCKQKLWCSLSWIHTQM